MRTLVLPRLFQFIVVTLLGLTAAQAQWRTQTIALQPGWNAVFLEVQPGDDDCDEIFNGLPIESVWAWNKRFSSVQFIQDPNELAPGQPNWLTYLPPDHAARATRNLFTLRSGQAYLIKLNEGAAAVNWNVIGQPHVRPTEWLDDSFNLVGFHVAPDSALTFQQFFLGIAAHAGKPVYQLNAAGRWELVANPASATIKAGKAYWIYSQGSSTYSGPLRVEVPRQDGLVYGNVLTEQTLRIKNSSGANMAVTLQKVASQTPLDGSRALAGDVPLAYYKIDAAQNAFGWVPFSEPLQKPVLAPGEEWRVDLEVVRREMAADPITEADGALYQGLIEISSGNGVRQFVAVSSEGLNGGASGQGLARQNVGVANPRAGLWVGIAAIEKVSQPARIAGGETPLATASAFQFRVIVHVDNAGRVHLLQKVWQMFKEGTLKPDPDNAALKIVDQPGRFVLVTDPALIRSFSGATLRDGQSVGRRISTTAFAFDRPVLMQSAGEFGAGRISCVVNIGFDDNLNPFKHRYHPDHDNLNERFEQKLSEGVESFTVSRQIEMAFTEEDPDELTIAGWGDNQLGGIYRETVTGLRNTAIRSEGTFRLTRASRIGTLNDGL